MSRNDNALVERFLGLKHNMAASLVDDAVTPSAAQGARQVLPAHIAWNFHPFARTSSRTR